MDTPSASDNVEFYIQDGTTAPNFPDIAIGYRVTSGVRHAYFVARAVTGAYTSIDVAVATDGLEHTLQGLVNGLNYSLYIDGVLAGSATGGSVGMSKLDLIEITEQRGLLASTVSISKVLVSTCPVDFPT